MMNIPKVKDRIVVYGMLHHTALVSKVTWDLEDQDWVIELDWGLHGKSRVKMRDEGKVWYQFVEMN